MKNSSLAILGALGLAGAAGVYLAMQDPAEEKVEDVSTQAADGSSGGDVMTKGELCEKLRTELIPNTKNQIQEAQDELADFESEARAIGVRYIDEVHGGSPSRNNRREEELVQYILTGSKIVIGPDGNKKPSAKTQRDIDNARNRVVSLETTIASLQTALGRHETDELSLVTEGVC